MKIGWYSKKQAELTGSAIYLNPESCEVEVTEIARKGLKPLLKNTFGDLTCVGEVKECLHDGQQGISGWNW